MIFKQIKWVSEVSRNHKLQIEGLFLLHYSHRSVLWAQGLIVPRAQGP